MCFIFREIRNKSWWDKSKDELCWLEDSELVADVFKGLGTENGNLSTYFVDADKSNVSRIVAAYACTRESIQRVDYVLLPLDTLVSAFSLRCVAGKTADDLVNGWHCDIVELTSKKLSDLAYFINDHKDSMTRVALKKVEKEVLKARNLEYIDFKKVNPRLQKKIPD